MTWIGALGASSFNNEIEDVSNVLVNRIIREDIYGSNYTDKVGIFGSNYSDKVGIWGSNYSDKVGIFGSNYTDKVGIYGSNYTDRQIEHTSNYVKITSNILEARIKALEGSEGSAGDISLGIPSIPSTGGVAVAAAIATITAACVGANGITAITLIDMLEDKVDLNKTQTDKIGGWSSNYSDKVGIWSSNYTDLVGKYTSNYSDKVGIWSSNYTDLQVKYTSNYADKVGIWGSNYTDLQVKYTSNYADKVGIWSSNYTDLVGIYGSNYADKVGIWSSNYTDLVGIYGSNYTDKVGIYSSNYSDKVGIYSSNYTDKVGIYSSNYSDKVGIYSSNYSDKVGIYSSNYADKVGIYSSNYADKVGIWGSNYADKVGIWGSNYADKEITHTSNYISRINTEFNTAISGLGTATNYWTEESTNNIYLNKSGNVGIGTTATTKLHIYQDTINDTKLIIQNNKTTSSTPPTDIEVATLSSTTIGNDKILSFPYTGTGATKDYSFTTTENLICDILVIGGGGGGGRRHAGAGGAGTLMYHKNIILNGTYNIKVGKGGGGNPAGSPNTGTASDGIFSQFTRSDGGQNYYAVGGGRGTSGGASYATTNGGQGYLYDANLTLSSGNIFNSVSVVVSNKNYVNTLTSPEGCRGNIGGIQVTNYKGGGGGGAGGAGMNHDAEATIYDGYGGLGLAVDITGASVVYAGGGNGSDINGSISQVFDPTYNTIQLRGGGGYGSDNGTPQNGLDGTGGGGGGQGNDTAGGGKGGDGIVIIRYRKVSTTSSSLELVRGTTTDGSVDYSVGNYEGIFKIKSVVNTGTPTDRLVINSSGNVGIGTASHATYKLDVNGDINISAGSQFRIDGNVLSTFTASSTNLISVFDATQFEDATSLIKIKTSWKPTTAGTADTANGLSAGTSISITAITASGLITGNLGLTIPSGQTLTSSGTLTASVINASGLITGNAGLTIPSGQTLTSSGTLTASVINASGLITGNAGLTIPSGQTLTSSGTLTTSVINASGLITATQTTSGTNDILNMRYDTRNGIRFQQRYIGTDDVRYDLIQKVANVDKTASLTIYNGNVGIGTLTPYNPLQVGTGGRLSIARGSTDFTLIGTSEDVNIPSTRIELQGYNYNNGTTYGDILYTSTRTGRHRFRTQPTDDASAVERLIINNNGNIGIGTTDPTAMLDIVKETGAGVITDLLNTRFDASWGLKLQQNYTGIGNIQYDFIHRYGAVNYYALTFKGIKVGMGTNNPVEKLHISGGSVCLGTYNTTSSPCYVGYYNAITGNDCLVGMEIENTTLGGNYSQKLHLRSHYYGVSHGRRLTIHENGYITIPIRLGIGGVGAVPTYTLDVPYNTTDASSTLGLRYFNYDTNIVASTTSLPNVCARFGGSIWCGSWIASSSDTRIKEDIQDINDDSALQMILAIEPKTYKYIDKIVKGNKIVYGFIAQQIKEVLPDAVGIEPNFIPNIMLLADYDNDIITLPSQPTKVIIKLNDKIRCYDKDNKVIDVVVIEIIDELTFKIKFNDNEPNRTKEPTSNSSNIDISNNSKYTDNKIFISGTEVDDFHTISKEYIFTLNVCATQELHRRIKSQEERIKELEAKMTDILKYLSL